MKKEKPRNGSKKRLLSRFKRRAKLVYYKILRLEDPPERIARGAAIGVLMGVLPTFGLGTILSLAAAFALKANKAAAILGSLIMNPLTAPFFWMLSAFVGSVLLQENYSSIYANIKNNGLATGAGWAYAVFLIGNGIVSVICTVGSYYIVKHAVIRHRRKKAEKLRRKRGH
ncbi:MAG: DUF2062 domain-containing protein [Candidatus Methylomirabilis sp.]|nr:DUF2062 domain-containing protein [Deltaproteobacteria bacterium]